MVWHHHPRNVWLTASLLAVPACSAAAERAPLTAAPGDPVRGAALVLSADKGNCAICHSIPGNLVPEGAAGDIGPPLDGVGVRYSAGELRQRVADSKSSNPATIMPSYFATRNLHRVQPQYADRPILAAQEVEDIVAFLKTLK